MNNNHTRYARVQMDANPQRVDFGQLFPQCTCGDWIISLCDWAIPVTDYVVNAANSAFVITIGGVPSTVTIAEGNYILASLVAALDSALKLVNASLAATYSVASSRITVSHAATFTLTFGARAAKLFGFTTGTTVLGTSATGANMPCCMSSAWYGIRATGFSISGWDYQSASFNVVSNAVSGSLATRSAESVCNAAKITGGVMAGTDISIVDQYGDLLPLRGQSALLVFEFNPDYRSAH